MSFITFMGSIHTMDLPTRIHLMGIRTLGIHIMGIRTMGIRTGIQTMGTAVILD